MGRGGFLHPIPICFVPWFLFLSLQRHLAAGRLRRPSVFGPFLSISFGGVDPHLVLLPWMPVLPPFLFSYCLVFRSRVLGAVVVASLDFWPNLGLSRLEKATRLFGLMFGRFIFEFGITGSAGSDHGSRDPPCPVSGGTTAHLARYYRWSGTAAVEARYYRWCGTAAVQARYYRRMPSSIVSYHMFIHICCVYLVLIVPSGCFVCPCVWFQVMNILSSKSAVSTPGVQRRSGTAHLRLQVGLPVLHSRQGVLPQVLILLARRRLPADRSQVARK